MTIKDLFETIDYSSYDKIILHWPMAGDNPDREFHNITFEYAEPLIELFGNIHIMTMNETSEYDGGDASLFINRGPGNDIIIHIYVNREDIVRLEK